MMSSHVAACPRYTTGLRPPFRPRAAAAARPARVRSWMRSRSNCPSAPKRWNTSLPPGVVVSIASVRERNPTPRFSKCRDGLDQVRQAAAQPIQLPDDQHVAIAHVVERLPQARSIGACAGRAVFKHLGTPCRGERVKLQCRILVQGADAGVSDVCQGELVRFPVRQSCCPTSHRLVQDFRTFRGWPLIDRLTDSPGERPDGLPWRAVLLMPFRSPDLRGPPRQRQPSPRAID